ncbi:hypothetical protein D3C85_1373840 [compost metagenome]
MGSAVQAVEGLRPEHNIVDADFRWQVFTTVAGKVAQHHGLIRQCVFSQSIKVVVVVERHALHVTKADDFFTGPPEAVIKVLLQARALFVQVKPFSACRFLEQIEPRHCFASHLWIGHRTFAPAALDRAF